MKISKYILALMISFITFGSASASEEEHPVYDGSKAFQQMKQLAGGWVGTVDIGKGPQTIKTSYRITSAGSALVETTFEGTPNEMITIYHDDKNRRLRMTHYCGLNNQPIMVLKSSTENMLEFELDEDAPIDAANEPHMHALSFTFAGQEMKQHWTQFAKGEKKKVVIISYKRSL
jgi:hypothetical protein